MPGGERAQWGGAAAVPAVLRAAGVAGARSSAPGSALPAGQPRVPGGVLRSLFRAPELGSQPHEDKAPPAVGQNENAKMELWVGELNALGDFKRSWENYDGCETELSTKGLNCVGRGDKTVISWMHFYVKLSNALYKSGRIRRLKIYFCSRID